MKITVIGANGQLGCDVCAAFQDAGHDVAALSHQQIELASDESVQAALEASRPELVVNTAAFHNVEKCEADAAVAFAVNALGARILARITSQLGAALMHISTDYVFDGRKSAPYIEPDAPAPLNVYGNSKLAGEYFVRAVNPRHFVLRVAGIYGHHPCRGKAGMNFVETMLKLARERGQVRVVDDEFTTPTPTPDIARQLVALAATGEYGLYHASAEGSCSWYEFAAAIFELNGTQVVLERARPGEFAVKVARPKYSVLENAALKRKGLNVMRHWREGLAAYLATRAEGIHTARVAS